MVRVLYLCLFRSFSGVIPPDIGHLRCLQTLDLSCNKLSGEAPAERTTIVSTFYNLTSNMHYNIIRMRMEDVVT